MLQEMNETYNLFCQRSEEVNNLHLDKQKPHVEQLVSCVCGNSFRVWVNGKTPTPDTEMKDVFCPKCGQAANNFVMLSGHSAGVFNASIIRQR